VPSYHPTEQAPHQGGGYHFLNSHLSSFSAVVIIIIDVVVIIAFTVIVIDGNIIIIIFNIDFSHPYNILMPTMLYINASQSLILTHTD
jgi:hypothetical protein